MSSHHFWWQSKGVSIHHYTFSSIDSTQDFALSLLNSRKEHQWTLVTSDTQRAGRGQFGRVWQSPRGGIYQTLICLWPSDPRWTSLVGALAICKAIEDLYGIAPRIKWKNDVLIDGKKVAGVLSEVVEHQGKKWLLLGIGLNVDTNTRCLCLDQKVISLQEKIETTVDKEALSCRVNAFLYSELKEMVQEGMTCKALEFFCERMAYRGESVYIRTAKGIFQGILQGISLEGGVVLDEQSYTALRLGKNLEDVA